MKQFSEATRVQMPAMVHLTEVSISYSGKMNHCRQHGYRCLQWFILPE